MAEDTDLKYQTTIDMLRRCAERQVENPIAPGAAELYFEGLNRAAEAFVRAFDGLGQKCAVLAQAFASIAEAVREIDERVLFTMRNQVNDRT